MRKNYFLTAMVLMTGFLSTEVVLGADNTSTEDIQALANVTAAVVVTPVSSLDFVTIMPGVDKTINFVGDVTTGGDIGTETAGHFTIDKGLNTQVILTLTAPSLTGGVGTTPITIDYTKQLSGVGAAVPVTTSPFSVAPSGLTAGYWGASSFSFDIGGTIHPAATQLAGLYSATVILTATYN